MNYECDIIDIDIPPNGKLLWNKLCGNPDKMDLDQDITAIEFPNNLMVDIGHYPSYDFSGEYRVLLTHNFQINIAERATKDPFEAAKIAEEFCKMATKCECASCQRHRRLRVILDSRDFDALASYVDEVEEIVESESLDAAILRQVLDGKASHGKEILEEALKKYG